MAFNKIVLKWGSNRGENAFHLHGCHTSCYYSPLNVIKKAFNSLTDGNLFDLKLQSISGMSKQSQKSADGKVKGPFKRCVKQTCAGKTVRNLCNSYKRNSAPSWREATRWQCMDRYARKDGALIKSKVCVVQNALDLSRHVSTWTSTAFQSRPSKEYQCFLNLRSYGVNGGITTIQMHGRVRDPSKLLFGGFKTLSVSGFVNPLIELQKYVEIPIIPPEEAVFSPTEEEVLQAARIFTGSRGGSKDSVRFVGSFLNGAEMPESTVPEVAFLGRSNVGKSSLIRSMLSAHPDLNIGISKKPGHTKRLNLYRIGRHFSLVDMAGYGYNMPRTFEVSVEGYLSSRKRLCRTFLLIDAEVGLTSADNIALGMMREFGIPFVIVLTKIDKASQHRVLKQLFAIMEVCKEQVGHTCFSQPFLVSSHSGEGLLLLETFIAYITGCIEIKGN